MKKRPHVPNLARLFRVLSDQTRVKLVAILREKGEQSVTELCKTLRLPQPTVSTHLGWLRLHGLVRNRRAGKRVYYSIDRVQFNRACKAVRGLFARR